MDASPVDPQTPAGDAAPILDYHPGGQRPQTVRLHRFGSGFEANLALSALLARGIRAQLAGENGQAMLGIYGSASNGVDLLVMQEDAEAARQLLEQIERRRAERAAAEAPHCPRCGSDFSRGYDRRLAVIGLLLAMTGAGLDMDGFGASFMALGFGGLVLLIIAITRRTCRRCGRTWTPTTKDD